MKDIPLLQKAIKETHGCESIHVESVPVMEQFQGKIAWQGTVEVFYLIDHPKATRAYAWTYRDGNQNKTIAVLKIPPVDSPQRAVKVAIASLARRTKTRTFRP
jgi:hypothetical protein